MAHVHACDGLALAPLLELLEHVPGGQVPAVDGAVEAARDGQRLGGVEVDLHHGLVAAFALEGFTAVVENLK